MRKTFKEKKPTGAVIVKDKRIISTGYNGSAPGQEQCIDKGSEFCFRRSVNGPEDDKYNVCKSIHAEANAINQLARVSSTGADGAEIYCTLAPCYVCLKSIASVGIKKVYFEIPYQSKDEDRDKVWSDFRDFGMEAEQVVLTDETVEAMTQIINNFTSIRRIK